MSANSLNQNELEAMRILWEHGELKPAEIQSRFNRKIENATLRSVLNNLVEKGHITRKQKGKAFHYVALVPKATLLQSMIRMLAHVFAGGSPQGLVAQLVELGDIKPKDLKVIEEMAANSASQKKRRIRL
jgi:BlaI family penicillinase repressor